MVSYSFASVLHPWHGGIGTGNLPKRGVMRFGVDKGVWILCIVYLFGIGLASCLRPTAHSADLESALCPNIESQRK